VKLGRVLEFFGLVAVAWTLLSYGLGISPHFLPKPHQFAATAATLMASSDFWWDCVISVSRVAGSVALSVLVAVPAGFFIARGSRMWQVLDAGVSFVRYLPPAGFVPLTILWFGIDESQKTAVLFIGTFFQLAPMIAHAASSVDRRWVEIGRLAGATRWKEWRYVVLPASAPSIVDAIRIAFGIAWTYLTVAEIVAAQSGLGHRIVVAQRYLQTDQMFVAILSIGLLGLLTDRVMRSMMARTFPWFSETSASALSV
jgi:NitT/TauT family transport system permease protein